MVFPLNGQSDSQDNSNFENFRDEVIGFFPNLNGVVGRAKYLDDQMRSLTITITTQFYGLSEIIAFTQQVADSGRKFLPKGIPIEIRIESIQGMEAFLQRGADQQSFSYHVFE